MAKISMQQREVKRMKTVQKYAEKRAELKKASVDMNLSYDERMHAIDMLAKLPRNASPVRLQRRCKVSGRPHAVYRKFGLSRNMLRLYAMQGDVPGLRKASW